MSNDMSSLIRWTPMWDPFEEIFFPAMNIYDTKDAVVAETPLAGVDPKDVEVNVERGVLTVKGATKKEHEVDEKNYYRKELRSGSFFRQIALPVAVKEDAVKAEFEDGVLKITCPKASPTVAKKVNVKVIKKSDKK